MSTLSAAHRWSEVIARQERSGLTIRDFARRNGLNANTLTWWRWRLRQEPASSPELVDFIEAEVVDFIEAEVVEDLSEPGIELHIDHLGARVTVRDDTDLHQLRRLLEALC